MTIDWTINLSVIIAFAVFIGGAIAGYAVWRYKIGAIEKELSEFKKESDIKTMAIDTTLRFQHDRAEEIRSKCAQELGDFRIEVAKDYAGHVALREMEQRLTAALNGLGVRIDKLTDARRSS